MDCYAQDRALPAAAAVIAALQGGTITGHGTAAHLFRPAADSRARRLQPTSDKFAAHF